MKIPRTLKENEIHIKAIPQSLKKVELMLYTDRITIMNIMDETYGVGKWQTSHKTRTKGDGSTEMFCEVKVFNEEIGQWLSREVDMLLAQTTGLERNSTLCRKRKSSSMLIAQQWIPTGSPLS